MTYCFVRSLLSAALAAILSPALTHAIDAATHPSAATHAVTIVRAYPGAAPCDATLQACISASDDNDIVQIQPGTYITDSLLITRAVSLIGAGASPAATRLSPTSGRMIEYAAASLTANTVISNLSIENGNASVNSGGAIRVTSGGAPLFHSLVISNNIGSAGAGIRVIPNVPVTLISVALISNTASAGGGGVSSSGSLTVVDSRFEYNRATEGGAINIGGALLTVQSTAPASPSVFTGNSASGNGGAIATNSDLKLIGDTQFTANSAGGQGGAVFANNVLEDPPNGARMLWSGNSATGNGGAIRAVGAVNLCQNGPEFQNNSAGAGSTSDGGAIFANTIVLCASRAPGISSNNRARRGGAFYGVASVMLNQHDVGANTAQFGGCAFSDGIVTFDGVDASGCRATNDGGAAMAITVLLQGNGTSLFTNNSAGGAGGVARATSLFVRDSTLISNTAQTAGALSGIERLDISNSTLSDNTARWGGGAGSAAVNLVVTNSVFSNNRVTDTVAPGGALLLGTTSLITGSTFTGNSAKSGGALALPFAGQAYVTGTVFLSNTATSGGAFAGSSITATASTFTGNQAMFGGAITATIIGIDNSLFERNEASAGLGGAIMTDRGSISGSTFIQNGASQRGSALYARAVTIARSTFLRNGADASLRSSALSLVGNSSVTDSVFDGNGAGPGTAQGGAIESSSGTLTVTGGEFRNNRASAGGAVFCQDFCMFELARFASNGAGSGGAIDARGRLIVRRSSFFSNTASANGGAIFHDRTVATAPGDSSIENSLFARNAAGARGNAIVISGTLNTVSIAFNTVVSSALTSGSAIAITAGSANVLNNIMTNHAIGIEQVGGTVSENANLLFGNTANLAGTITSGSIAIGGDPLFVQPQADNYHLFSNSPAIDAGVAASVNIDIDGDARPFDGGFDIGYDEFNPSAAPQHTVHLPLVRR